MPPSHLILCRPLLLLPPIPPSIRVFPMSQLSASGGQPPGILVSGLSTSQDLCFLPGALGFSQHLVRQRRRPPPVRKPEPSQGSSPLSFLWEFPFLCCPFAKSLKTVTLYILSSFLAVFVSMWSQSKSNTYSNTSLIQV